MNDAREWLKQDVASYVDALFQVLFGPRSNILQSMSNARTELHSIAISTHVAFCQAQGLGKRVPVGGMMMCNSYVEHPELAHLRSESLAELRANMDQQTPGMHWDLMFRVTSNLEIQEPTPEGVQIHRDSLGVPVAISGPGNHDVPLRVAPLLRVFVETASGWTGMAVIDIEENGRGTPADVVKIHPVVRVDPADIPPGADNPFPGHFRPTALTPVH